MDWDEFVVLVSGLMPDTPLGKIIEIRSEDDRDMLKHFSPRQREIRNEWRSKQSQELIESMSEEELDSMAEQLKAMFANMAN